MKNICTRSLYDCDPTYNIRVITCFMCAEFLLAFSPLGFIVLPNISVSTLYVGVMVSALWGGPAAGACVGLAYGLCSMWKASVTATSANDLIFSPVLSTDPTASWILALVPRMLFGILCGLIFLLVLKIKNKKGRIIALIGSCLFLERMHSALTYWFMKITFHVNSGFLKAWTAPITGNRIATWIFISFIVLLFYTFYEKVLSKRYYREYRDTLSIPNKLTWRYIVLITASFIALGLATIHFMDRTRIILLDIDGLDPASISIDRMLQVLYQFLTACTCSIYILVVLYRHNRLVMELSNQRIALDLQQEVELSKKLEQIAMHDPLTELYNRQGMAMIIDRDKLEHRPVTFALIDIDHFKQINDNLGHDEGDHVLQIIAKHLKKEFGKECTFRLGGDEFVLLLTEDIEKDPEEFFSRFTSISFPTQDQAGIHNVTFSVGAICRKEGISKNMYRLADRALYIAKNKGRDNGALINENGECLYIHKA